MASDRLELRVALLEQSHSDISKRIKTLEDLQETVVELRVKLGEFSTQLKVTWFLMTLLLGGIVSVAFSLWQ